MNKVLYYKIILAFILIITLAFTAKYSAERFVAKRIKTITAKKNINFNFEELSVNLFLSEIKAKNVVIESNNLKENSRFSATISNVQLGGINLIKLLFQKEISLKNVYINQPKIKISKSKSALKNKTSKKIPKVTVETVTVKNGKINYYETLEGPANFKIDTFNLKLKKIVFPKSIKSNTALPFQYTSINSEIIGINKTVGKHENLTIERLLIDQSKIFAYQAKLKTKYGKKEFSKYLKKEKDHITLSIPKIKVDGWFYTTLNNTKLIGAKFIKIQEADLKLFRDKAVADNIKYKSLYSEKMRTLNLKIEFPNINFEKATFNYEQLLEDNLTAGKLHFTNIDGNANLSNLKKELILFNVKGNFMGTTPVILKTKFDSFKSDIFTATGSIKNFDAKTIQKFLEKNQRIRLEGKANDVNFKIAGNNTSSNGTIKIKYTDLKLEILKKDNLKVNKFLTKIGSLFIKDKDHNPKEYQYGKIKTERDQTKSFFNFLWLSLKDGLKDVLINK